MNIDLYARIGESVCDGTLLVANTKEEENHITETMMFEHLGYLSPSDGGYAVFRFMKKQQQPTTTERPPEWTVLPHQLPRTPFTDSFPPYRLTANFTNSI